MTVTHISAKTHAFLLIWNQGNSLLNGYLLWSNNKAPRGRKIAKSLRFEVNLWENSHVRVKLKPNRIAVLLSKSILSGLNAKDGLSKLKYPCLTRSNHEDKPTKNTKVLNSCYCYHYCFYFQEKLKVKKKTRHLRNAIWGNPGSTNFYCYSTKTVYLN